MISSASAWPLTLATYFSLMLLSPWKATSTSILLFHCFQLLAQRVDTQSVGLIGGPWPARLVRGEKRLVELLLRVQSFLDFHPGVLGIVLEHCEREIPEPVGGELRHEEAPVRGCVGAHDLIDRLLNGDPEAGCIGVPDHDPPARGKRLAP